MKTWSGSLQTGLGKEILLKLNLFIILLQINYSHRQAWLDFLAVKTVHASEQDRRKCLISADPTQKWGDLQPQEKLVSTFGVS